MHYLWEQMRGAIPLIAHGDPYIMGLLWVTIRVAIVSTVAALLIGLPIGLALGLGRFRGRQTLQILANACLALPSVVVGIAVLLVAAGPPRDLLEERPSLVDVATSVFGWSCSVPEVKEQNAFDL